MLTIIITIIINNNNNNNINNNSNNKSFDFCNCYWLTIMTISRHLQVSTNTCETYN